MAPIFADPGPTHGPVLASGAKATAITISVGIIFIVGAVIAVVVWSYFRLQSHRADAVAMAEYRKLAEEAVANQPPPSWPSTCSWRAGCCSPSPSPHP